MVQQSGRNRPSSGSRQSKAGRHCNVVDHLKLYSSCTLSMWANLTLVYNILFMYRVHGRRFDAALSASLPSPENITLGHYAPFYLLQFI